MSQIFTSILETSQKKPEEVRGMLPPLLLRESAKKDRRKSLPILICLFSLALMIWFMRAENSIKWPFEKQTENAGSAQDSAKAPQNIRSLSLPGPEAKKTSLQTSPSTSAAQTQKMRPLLRKPPESVVFQTTPEKIPPEMPVKQASAAPLQKKLAARVPDQDQQRDETPVNPLSAEDKSKNTDIFLAKDKSSLQTEKIVQPAVAITDSTHTILLEKGVQLLKTGNAIEAKEVFLHILAKDERNVQALINLGVAALRQQEDDNAEEYFNRALAVMPSAKSALVNLAFMASRKNDTQLLEKYCRKVLAIDPEHKGILLRYCSLLEQQQRFPEALALYEQFLATESGQQDGKMVRTLGKRMTVLKGLIKDSASDATADNKLSEAKP